MTKTKKSLTVGLAAALMLTTSMTAFAIPADGNRPDPVIAPESAPVFENLLPVLPGEEVGIVEADEFDDAEDEDEDGEDLADDDDDDEDDVADEDGEDEDDVADEDGEDEGDVADEDGDDDEDVADEDDEDGEDEEDDIAEGDDEDGDEEVDVAEGDEDVTEIEGAVFEVVAKWDCENLYCGRLQVRDEYGNVIDTSEIHLDEEFVEDATPADMSFHNVHVGCRLRGYFAPVEGADGETREGFYVQEFL